MLNYTDLLGQDPAVIPTTPAYFETPLGSVLLLASADGLMLCDFIDRSDVLLRWMSRNLIVSRHQPFGAEHPVLLQAQRYLSSYFNPGSFDERRSAPLRAIDEQRSAPLRAIDEQRSAPLRAIEEVPPPPLDTRGTDFQRAAWEQLRLIPLGETADYGVISRRLGRSGSSAALSRALTSNPLAIFIPCHRVVGPEELVASPRGPARRTWLLGHERRVRRGRGRISLAPTAPLIAPLIRPA